MTQSRYKTYEQVKYMNTLTIHNPFLQGMTMIPNIFLDHYMPKANGEFVKIFLYLLRTSSDSVSLSLNTIADSMNCTENDVIRAFKYWEKEGLLEISYDAAGTLTHIALQTAPLSQTASVTAAKDVPVQQQTAQTAYSGNNASPAEQAQNKTQDKSELIHTQSLSAQEKKLAKKQMLTADKVKELKENEDIAQLLFIAQQYLGKTLTPSETSRILYFYDGLGFDTDLIEYLIEYCVSKGHKSMHYIEKVAFAWKEDGITDIQTAKKSAGSYHKDYYTILKALGIRGRNPIDAEVAIMKSWKEEYGFTIELIVEACTRTILATKQPSLQYADRILQSWKTAGVHTMADVHKLDLAHEQTKADKPAKKQTKSAAAATRFSNFEQRNYDFDSLESQLLNE